MPCRPGLISATCVCLAAALAPAPSAGAQTPACPPGVAVTPAFTAFDTLDSSSDTRLTATHVITVTAAFPTSGAYVDESTVKWTGPPGVPVFTYRTRHASDLDIGDATQAGFQPPSVGPVPVTATWQQSDGSRDGMCTGSASTTLQIVAAKPLRTRAPQRTIGATVRTASEYEWVLKVGRDGDRRPIEVRARSVHGAHLPGPRVAFKTLRVALRPTDPGWGAPAASLRLRFLSARAELDSSFLTLLVDMQHVTSNPKLGYELELRQGTRRIGRIRAAGSCSAFGCDFSTFRIQR